MATAQRRRYRIGLAGLAVAIAMVLSPAIGHDHDEHHHSDHAHMHDDAPVGADESVGTVRFRADCAEPARTAFNRALALMHHMMYEQARAEFAAIAAADRDCAMAYWGVATTLFQPLWGTTPSQDEVAMAREAIERARTTVADDNHREGLLIESTAAFFEPDTERLWDRMTGWIDGMATAYQAYPDDLDVASLYALSLLTQAMRADDRHALHDEAEGILQRVWEQQDDHPGAIHYAIHATDADGRAENALHMVEVYGEIAPRVPHALHMPSHIYVRLGDWPEVIDWNTRSAEAALDHRVNGDVSFHYIHAVDYLVYGHLQRGEDRTAKRIWETARAKGRHQGSFPGAFHLAAIPARLAVERRDWTAAAAVSPRDPDYIAWDRFQWPEGLSWYARGLGAAHTGDLESAQEAEQRLAELVEASENAADSRFAVYLESDRKILSGFIAQIEGDGERAVELMRAAGELEASVEKHPVTPGALFPPYEALGELLLRLDRPEEALAAFEKSDQQWPGRYNTLFGALTAAQGANDDAAASKWADRLLEVAPESERPTIASARELASSE